MRYSKPTGTGMVSPMPGKSMIKSRSAPGYMAVILVILGIIFTGWLSQVSIGLHKTLYNKEFYQCSLQEVRLEDELRVMLIEYTIMESDRPISIALSDISMIANALASAIDEEWLKGKIEATLDDAVAFVLGDREEFVVKFPLREKQAIFEEEMRKNWKAYPGYAKLEELDIEVPDPTMFIEKIDLPGEITIIELSSLSELEEDKQTAVAAIRSAEQELLIAPYLLVGLLVPFSLIFFGLVPGLKWLGAGLFSSGLSLYLLWPQMESAVIDHAPAALEPYGLSFLASPEITATVYSCALAAFTDIHMAFAGLGLLLIAAAYVIQLGSVLAGKARKQ